MQPEQQASPSPSEPEVCGTSNADSSTLPMHPKGLVRVHLTSLSVLSSSLLDVPKPTDVGLPYEDVTLTTSDGLKLKAYVIPARRRFIPTHEMQAMSSKERKERAEKEVEAWAEEMGGDDALEVSGC